MTADDIWGHNYIDINGNSYDEKTRPDRFGWMIHFYYKDNDGYAFMRKGAQRRICLRINPLVELGEANEALIKYQGSKHGLDEKTAKKIFSKLENMIRDGERDSELSD